MEVKSLYFIQTCKRTKQVDYDVVCVYIPKVTTKNAILRYKHKAI